MKFHENSSAGSRVQLHRHTDWWI